MLSDDTGSTVFFILELLEIRFLQTIVAHQQIITIVQMKENEKKKKQKKKEQKGKIHDGKGLNFTIPLYLGSNSRKA